MSEEDERKNNHNKNKQKMKSVQEEEEAYKPILRELVAELDEKTRLKKKSRTPRFGVAEEPASQSTDPLPFEQGKTGTDLLVSGSISGKTPSSVAVQVNRNKAQSSKVAQGRKKSATGKNKGIVIHEEEVLGKRERPRSYNVEPLPKGSIVDSEYDITSDDETDESDRDYNPDESDRDDDPDEPEV